MKLSTLDADILNHNDVAFLKSSFLGIIFGSEKS